MSTLIRSYYAYVPSTPAAIAAGVLYGAAALVTFVLWIKYRSWVWVTMVLGALMEAFGYIIRIPSTKSPDNRNLYIVQFCLIILAPVLMAAACYVIFGRIVYHVVPPSSRTMRLLWVPPRYVTPIFVICDLVAFLIQAIGAIIVSGTQLTDPDAASKLNRGKNIVLTGLGVQLACFGLFSVSALRFHFTSKQFSQYFDSRVGEPVKRNYYAIDGGKHVLKKGWNELLYMVNLTCLLILVRSIYRVCDFTLGRQGYIETHEWCTYVFDAIPIYPCVALFIYWHPAKYLPYLGFRLPRHVRKGPGDHQPTGVELAQ